MEKYIRTADGLSLWTESFGKPSNPAILLIMGAMNQGIFWPDEFCRELAHLNFHVIRYDHRDTGKSDSVEFKKNPYDLIDMAEDAISVLKGHGAQNAVLTGLSMGGYIAQLIAINHQNIVNKLILISTTADHRPYMAATTGQAYTNFSLPGPEKILLDYIRFSVNKPATEKNLIRGWEIMYSKNRKFPAEQMIKTLRAAAERSPDQSKAFNHALAVAASPDRLESIKKISAPTLIIHGKYDPCLPLAHGKYLADNIPDAELQELEMGHAFQWSWSDEILSLMAGFIKKGK